MRPRGWTGKTGSAKKVIDELMKGKQETKEGSTHEKTEEAKLDQGLLRSLRLESSHSVQHDQSDQPSEPEQTPGQDHPASVLANPSFASQEGVGCLLQGLLCLELLLLLSESIRRVRGRGGEGLVRRRRSGFLDSFVESDGSWEGDELNEEEEDGNEAEESEMRSLIEPERFGDVSTAKRYTSISLTLAEQV